MNRYAIYSIFLIFLSACKPTIEQVESDFDSHYFPMELYSWKTYQVKQITIDEATNVFDTVFYQLKEVYNNWQLDGENDSVIIIKRYTRQNETLSWREFGTWSVGIKDNIILQTEENLKYVKLNFPVIVNKEWNGDAYNMEDTLQVYQYKYTTVDSLENYNNQIFDRVITVTQKYKSTLIDKISFKEKYQYNLGLIYKEQIDIYDEDVEYGVPIEERVSKGTFYYQTILDYGSN